MCFYFSATFFGQARPLPSTMSANECRKEYQSILSSLSNFRPYGLRMRTLPPDPLRLPGADGLKRKSYEADTIEPLVNVARVKKISPKRLAENFPRNMDVDDAIWFALDRLLLEHWLSPVS